MTTHTRLRCATLVSRSTIRGIGGTARIHRECVTGREWRCEARNEAGNETAPTTAPRQTVTIWNGQEISRPLLTTYLPIALVLAILAYLDAAYSGDWSRIGVISKETESFLQTFCIFGGAIHALLGVAAAKISKDRGERTWLVRGLKTFAVGVTSFTEVYFLPEDDM